MAERTPAKHLTQYFFKPGQSGNPAGRPKGSRNRLSEEFIAAMCDDFEAHGKSVIETVRAEKPDQYLKVIASIIPKELHVADASLDDMSDNELIDILATLRSFTSPDGGKKTERRAKAPSRDDGPGDKLN